MSAAFQHHHIIGIGRSGTTLLQSLLNAHPDIWAGPEDYFIPFFYHAWKNKTEFTPQDLQRLDAFHKAFGSLQPYVGFTYDSDALLLSKPKNFNEVIRSSYNAFIDDLAPQKEANVYGDDSVGIAVEDEGGGGDGSRAGAGGESGGAK